jgi:hypothetical protein
MKKEILDLIVTISTVLIAISALVVSIWQGKVARRHSKLSVKPRLQLLSDYDKSLSIKNTGLGPAFLSSLLIIYEGEKYDFFKRNEVERLMVKAGLDDHAEWGDAWGNPTLGVGDVFILWRLKGQQSKRYEDLMHILNRSVGFNGVYKSLYDDVHDFKLSAH